MRLETCYSRQGTTNYTVIQGRTLHRGVLSIIIDYRTQKCAKCLEATPPCENTSTKLPRLRPTSSKHEQSTRNRLIQPQTGFFKSDFCVKSYIFGLKGGGGALAVKSPYILYVVLAEGGRGASAPKEPPWIRPWV